MAWATKIATSEQVIYRLEAAGCDLEHRAVEHQGAEHEVDRQVEYRLQADLRWIGSGLGEVDLVAGERVDKAAAKALMDGRHPTELAADGRQNERLVSPKMAVAPAARVAATDYVAAIHTVAEAAGIEPGQVFRHATAAARFARLERGLQRDGERHTIPIGDLEQLAAAAHSEAGGVAVPGLDDVYSEPVLAEARAHRDERVRVDQRGTDITLDLPKSVSALYAVVDEATATVIEAEYMAAVTETVGALEGWASYGVTGEHGNGKIAARIESSGFLGWTMLHRSARPVEGRVGDPHLHAHAVLAHMVRCEDGTWRAPGSGGRDIYRHVAASGEFVKARVRARLSERLGVEWEQDETTRAWEIRGIPRELRTEFSGRHRQIQAVAAGASPARQRAEAARLAESRPDVEPTDVRAQWRAAADRVVPDVEAMLADVMPGPGGPGLGPGRGPDGPVLGPGGPHRDPAPTAAARAAGPVAVPSVDEIAARIWTGKHALTAHTKAVSRVQILTAVAGACPGGVADVAQLEALTDAVIEAGPTIAVPVQHASHHTNTTRWTTRDIVEAEHTITTGAQQRLQTGAAAVDEVVAEATVTTWAAQRGLTLSGEQAEAVHRLVTGGHGIDAVIGVAGAGKTTLMAAARTVWEDGGYTVAGASTAAVASAGLAAEAGITSRTIASWLGQRRDDPDGPTLLTAAQQLQQAREDAARLKGVDVLVVDEGAMVDDRALARLVRAAEPGPANPAGTKIVLIGDHLQSRAIGVGGGFRAVHEVVAGAQLQENRRQRDPVEREALQIWREDGRRTALDQLAGHDRIHAVELPEQVHAEMLTAWDAARARYAGDPHEQVSGLVMLARRNVDVDALNEGARAVRIAAGELPADDGATLYHRSVAGGGGTIALAPGDLVRVRQNDYRSRNGTGEPDVLNGFRAVVTAVDEHRQVRIEWRRPDPHAPGGHRTEGAWISPAAISDGHLSHGYAMTVAASQGMTCDLTLASGVGADAHSLYPALTRARESTHLWLARTAVEDDTTAAVLGPATDDDRLARTIAAYADQLERDRPDSLISELLTHDQTAAHVRAVLAGARREAEHRHRSGQPDQPPTDPAPTSEPAPPTAPLEPTAPIRPPVPAPELVPSAAQIAAQNFPAPLILPARQSELEPDLVPVAQLQAASFPVETPARPERNDTQHYAPAARAALGERADDVLTDPAWPVLAAALRRAEDAGISPERALNRRAVRDTDSLAVALNERVHRIVDYREYLKGEDTEGAERARALRAGEQRDREQLNELREQQRLQRQEREQAQAELSQVRKWQKRPHGQIPTSDLPQQIAAAEQRAAGYRRQIAADQQRLQADPIEVRLARARQQLEAADIAAHGAARHSQRAETIQRQIDTTAAHNGRDLSELRTEQTAAGRRFGDVLGRHAHAAEEIQTRIQARTEHLAELRQQHQRALDQAHELRESATKIRTDLGARYPSEPTQTTLSGLTRRYANDDYMIQTGISANTHHATEAERTATGLRKEASLRESLSPAARQLEDTDRTTNPTPRINRYASARAAGRGAASHDQDISNTHHHDRLWDRGPSQGRGGPSLGR